MKNPRPEPRCALCGEARPLKRGRCADCKPSPRTRVVVGRADAKLASWGDVEGQLDLFGAGE